MRWWKGGLFAVMLGVLQPPALALSSTGTTRAPSAILIDAQTGQTLREDRADTPAPPGALTQLMVLLLSLEQASLVALPLDRSVTISSVALSGLATGSTRIPLRADRAYRLSDLLKAMVVGGADDAVVAVAHAVGGAVPDCVELMNARAQRLGMSATHYASLGSLKPSAAAGADTTTARDLARLAHVLVGHGQVLQWASISGLPFDDGSILLRNNDQLIGTVPGADGLQVSSGRAAGYSIVATAERGGLRLIAVVLGAADSASRYDAAAALLEWGFAHYERLDIVKKGEPLNLPIRIVNGSVSQLTPVAGQTCSLLRRRDEEHDLRVRYQLPAVLAAPLKRHAAIGEVIVEEQGELIAVIPILSPISVSPSGVLSAGLP